MPPTRLLRSGALTVDPFLLRGVSLGAGWHAERGGAAGSVYHAAAGALPIASGIPVVAALLDLAPWSLPEAYQRATAARFGQRLRARILRDAAAVIVPSDAAGLDGAARCSTSGRPTCGSCRSAPRAGIPPRGGRRRGAAERVRLGLARRYVVYAGRYDARHDLADTAARRWPRSPRNPRPTACRPPTGRRACAL